ncbi:La protein 1 [Quillaja saponaria]|uniref:La protein 1 n=1 Tax=Quillaja saponaria TaxID=32244 RepID=A0AAD7PEF1_QUISA|nr:La protein 1 [Quillaja saponaria]
MDIVVSLALICSFSRMRNYLGLRNNVKRGDVPDHIIKGVAEILRSSDFLKVSDDGKQVGRATKLPKLEDIIEQVDTRTVAVMPLEYDVKMEDLEAFFVQYGKINSVRLPHHTEDKRCFCGTALIEFSIDEEAKRVLKKNLVYAGTELELKPKKMFDSHRAQMVEDVEKIRSSTGSSNKNNGNVRPNYLKGLLITFKLRRMSIRGSVKSNSNAVPTTNTEGITKKKSKSKKRRVEHRVDASKNVVSQLEKPVQSTEKKASDGIGGSEDKISDVVVDHAENHEKSIRSISTSAGFEEKDIVSCEDLKDFFQRFGPVKNVDYIVGADSGCICFEEPEYAIKACAAAAFLEDGDLKLKNFIASLETITGEAESSYWDSYYERTLRKQSDV